MLPFDGGLAGDENGALILAAAAAMLYLVMVFQPPSMRRTLIKAGSTGLLAVLAYRAGGPDFLVAALGFSAIGDAALAQIGTDGRDADDAAGGEKLFLMGLGAFLAAHLCFAWLFAGMGTTPGSGGLAAIAVICAFALAFGAIMVRRAGALAVPVAVYVAAIAAMGVSSATVGGLVVAGAVLFMASDTLLGAEKFLIAGDAPQRRFTTPAVWVLYWTGQAMITVGVLAYDPLAGFAA
jgi:uncharacterized membrane protein YhhN